LPLRRRVLEATSPLGGDVAKTVGERAAELGMKAMSKLFEDPKRAEAIAKAIGGLQQAKAAIDDAQEKALRAAGLVTREDFKSAGKRLSALKRRVRDLTDELDSLVHHPQAKK
jgi:polyhydroxyalkanoate synthesis regulator phasin